MSRIWRPPLRLVCPAQHVSITIAETDMYTNTPSFICRAVHIFTRQSGIGCVCGEGGGRVWVVTLPSSSMTPGHMPSTSSLFQGLLKPTQALDCLPVARPGASARPPLSHPPLRSITKNLPTGIVYQPRNQSLVRAQTPACTACALVATRPEIDGLCYCNRTEDC